MPNRLKQIEIERSKLAEEAQQIRRRKMWKCANCNKRTRYVRLKAYLPLYEVPADGHGGGGYHTWGGTEIQIVCPKCNVRIRHLANTEWNYERVRYDILPGVFTVLNEHIDLMKTIRGVPEEIEDLEWINAPK